MSVPNLLPWIVTVGRSVQEDPEAPPVASIAGNDVPLARKRAADDEVRDVPVGVDAEVVREGVRAEDVRPDEVSGNDDA